jgi:hypothetical protein
METFWFPECKSFFLFGELAWAGVTMNLAPVRGKTNFAFDQIKLAPKVGLRKNNGSWQLTVSVTIPDRSRG